MTRGNRLGVMGKCFLATGLLACSLASTGKCLATDGQIENRGLSLGKYVTVSGDVKGYAQYWEYGSDDDYLTRLRLQLEVKPFDNLRLTGRATGTKTFEFENSADDDDITVDRLFVSWNNIGGTPVYFAGGRLPTMGENSPSHLRLGLDRPDGSLAAFTNIILDGATLGYAYKAPFTGSIQLYYAAQVDAGYEHDTSVLLPDTDIYGLKWEIYREGYRSIALQSFLIKDVRNLREDTPIGLNFVLHSEVLGDIYQTAFTYVDRCRNLDFFLSLGWSRTHATNMDDLGTGLLSSFFDELKDKDGFAVYAGARYDLASLRSKIGLEFNHGSKNWISFQNFESAKLATRGSVAEAYWAVNLPLPAGASKYLDSIIARIGYQYFWYDYTGSGFWLGAPIKIDDIQNDPFWNNFYQVIDKEYKLYAALEIYF